MRWCLLLAVVFACGCATLTPEGARVSVYRDLLEDPPPQQAMPEGCRLLATKPPVSWSELDLEGQKDPFRAERNEAGAAGANALLVLSRMTMGRRGSGDCPTATPITECGGLGARFRVAFESYACTAEGLGELSTRRPKRQTGNVY